MQKALLLHYVMPAPMYGARFLLTAYYALRRISSPRRQRRCMVAVRVAAVAPTIRLTTAASAGELHQLQPSLQAPYIVILARYDRLKPSYDLAQLRHLRVQSLLQK